jgi:hypothetical protein
VNESWVVIGIGATASMLVTFYKLFTSREDNYISKFVKVIEDSNKSNEAVATAVTQLTVTLDRMSSDLPRMSDVKEIVADYHNLHEKIHVKLDKIIENIG